MHAPNPYAPPRETATTELRELNPREIRRIALRWNLAATTMACLTGVFIYLFLTMVTWEPEIAALGIGTALFTLLLVRYWRFPLKKGVLHLAIGQFGVWMGIFGAWSVAAEWIPHDWILIKSGNSYTWITWRDVLDAVPIFWLIFFVVGTLLLRISHRRYKSEPKPK